MRVLLSYEFVPHTTAVYLEKAIKKKLCFTVCNPKEVSTVVNNSFIDFLLEVESSGVPTAPLGTDIPTAIWTLDTHLDLPSRIDRAKMFDYVFCPHKQHIEELYRQTEKPTFWLPYACDLNIHKDYQLDRIHDVTFVGHVHRDEYGNTFPIHDSRGGLLALLEKHFKCNIKENLYLDEMAKEYSQSKIVFNHSVRNDINMRLFEAMACGGCLITSELTPITGIGDLFKFGTIENITPEDCFLMYRNGDELVKLIQILLEGDELRKTIAKNGYQAVQKHTYEHRLDKILKVIGGMNDASRVSADKHPSEGNTGEKR